VKYEIEQTSHINGGNNMKLLTNKKAVSTFILIILILCSAVFGALVSYLWVMANYYNMPDTTLLIVTNVVFPGPPVINLTYFNVTILNPSNSISDVNITAVRLSVEGKNEVYNITATDPEPLPFLLMRGTEHTFKCKKNWSNFAGETVRIEPVAANTSTKSYLYTTPRVRLTLTPNFDATKSVEYFDLAIENSASIANITLSEIMLFDASISKNVTPSLPYPLSPNLYRVFRCDWNWESLKKQNVTITVKSSEGYETNYTTNKLLGATLSIQEVKFDYTDVTYFNLTISNSAESTASATINRINLTLQDKTKIAINNTVPPIIVQSAFNLIPPNQSRTFKCFWNWTQYRNETLSVDAYALEDFTIPSKTTKTPPAVVWNVTDINFDLDYVEGFSVNVTNTLCSLQNITVTKILLNNTETNMAPSSAVLTPGTQMMFNCTLPWAYLRGKNVTITILTQEQSNASTIVTIPSLGLKLPDKPATSESLGLYVNITISNSNNSLRNATITKIIFETGNWTGPMIMYSIDGTLSSPAIAPQGYILKPGEKVTIVCRWNWGLYLLPCLKVTVYTAEGIQISKTFTT
jgi:hypothetical protein